MLQVLYFKKAIYVIIEKVMSAIVIIPARFQSTRFPGKPIATLQNKPMIRHVYERAKQAALIEEVYVATDSRPIFDAIRSFGGNVIMTNEKHTSGTDRIAEAAEIIRAGGHKADVIVNVQGDEPMIQPEMIDMAAELLEDKRADIGTLVKRVYNPTEINDPNVVKAVFNIEGFALYFSRSPIPYHRDLFGTQLSNFNAVDLMMFKHIGIYAYRDDVLERFAKLPASRLEETEKLEQLRAIENGITIKVRETIYDTIGVDTPEDLKRVEKCLNTSL
jgi:3-deoxy-manno-octulosonate cytidylyltransferase (CMP-KDO synthetase)